MIDIDQKNSLIHQLESENRILEQRIGRLKQVASGLKTEDKIETKLETELSLRKELMKVNKENSILKESLIDIKLKWANSEHERESVTLRLVDLSEEYTELKERYDLLNPNDE